MQSRSGLCSLGGLSATMHSWRERSFLLLRRAAWLRALPPALQRGLGQPVGRRARWAALLVAHEGK